MNFQVPLFMILVALATSNSELLDTIDTKEYWETQNVKVNVETMLAELAKSDANDDIDIPALIEQLGDRDFQTRERASEALKAAGKKSMTALEQAARDSDIEVATRARSLLQQLKSSDNNSSVRRLMAIRALGELKDTEALAALEKLTQSKTQFEADYARNAISFIKTGKATRSKLDKKTQMQNLWLLPEKCGYVAQVDMRRMTVGSATATSKLIAMLDDRGENDPQQFKKVLTERVIKIANMVGNIRLESLTLGVAENVGNRSGFVVLIFDGLYNKEAVETAILKEFDIPPLFTEIKGVKRFDLANECCLLTVSDQQLILVAGPVREDLPVDAMLNAIKTGKGTLANNAEMVALIERADNTKPLWGAARLTDLFWHTIEMDREQLALGTFQDVILEAERTEEGISLKLRAEGTAEQKVKESVKMLQSTIAAARLMIEQQQDNFPSAKGFLDFFDSIEYQPVGKKLSVTATFESIDLVSGMITRMMALVWGRNRAEDLEAMRRGDGAPVEIPGQNP